MLGGVARIHTSIPCFLCANTAYNLLSVSPQREVFKHQTVADEARMVFTLHYDRVYLGSPPP